MDASHNTLDADDRRARLTAMITSEPRRLRQRSISLGVAVDDADDVAQTAVMRAWRSVERLHSPEPGQMCSWLDTIVRNAATDLARERARKPIGALDDDVAAHLNIALEVEQRVILDGALQALNELPESLREPLLLSVVDNVPAAEIAERLGIAPSAVRQRIARARKSLNVCKENGMSADASVKADPI